MQSAPSSYGLAAFLVDISKVGGGAALALVAQLLRHRILAKKGLLASWPSVRSRLATLQEQYGPLHGMDQVIRELSQVSVWLRSSGSTQKVAASAHVERLMDAILAAVENREPRSLENVRRISTEALAALEAILE